MIEKIADDLIGQMTEARLIDKEMEARYVYVFICWIEKFITVGSIIVISLMFHKLLPTIFFLVFFLELRKRTGGYHLDKFYRCYLASIVSYLVIVIISEKLSEHPQWLFAIVLLAITGIGLQIPLHRITDSASNGSVFPVVTEHFSASSDHAFL